MIAHRRYKPLRPASILAWLILAAFLAWRYAHPPEQAPLPESIPDGEHAVERVVDGDTLLLANRTRVRLIGVNTPETVAEDRPVEPWGLEASEFTKNFVESGPVRLTFDRERLDQYDRLLAYVWRGDRMLNEELLRAGLARWEQNYNYAAAMKSRFRQAQQEAKTARRGLWSGGQPAAPR